MKRFHLLILALLAISGCGQSQEAAVPADRSASEPAVAAPVSEAAPGQAAETAPPAATTNAPSEAAASGRIELAQADLSAVEAAGYIEGRHYLRLSPVQPTNAPPGQVEVNEFFMHTCPHCRTLEPYVQAWLENKPDYINFVRVPTTWADLNVIHAHAYYAAVSLGIEDEIMNPFFAELHDRGNDLGSPDKLADFFARFDVDRDEFKSLLSSFLVTTQVNNAAALGQRYRVDSTPTIVIAGKYKTLVDRAGGFDQLFELIELLAAAERGQ